MAMITIRKSHERGRTQYDWLNSFHTFSFADYDDPHFMGWSSLRVINEDTVQAGMGFGRHPHHDMDIISYVVQGSLEHRDSMGTGSIIKPGEIQLMSAGSGVEHSEFNHSKSDALHFLQIWIIPDKTGLTPSYEQKTIPHQVNQWILIGSQAGGDHAVILHQQTELFVAYLSANQSLQYAFKKGRKGWLQLIKGRIDLNAQVLSAGDGAAMADENNIVITCLEEAELLLFDLAG
jgi:quercetin 2,3-dioxygenase